MRPSHGTPRTCPVLCVRRISVRLARKDDHVQVSGSGRLYGNPQCSPSLLRSRALCCHTSYHSVALLPAVISHCDNLLLSGFTSSETVVTPLPCPQRPSALFSCPGPWKHPPSETCTSLSSPRFCGCVWSHRDVTSPELANQIKCKCLRPTSPCAPAPAVPHLWCPRLRFTRRL